MKQMRFIFFAVIFCISTQYAYSIQQSDALSFRDSILTEARFLKSIYKTDEAFDLLYILIDDGQTDEEVLSETADCLFLGGEYAQARVLYNILKDGFPEKILYDIRLMLSEYRLNNYEDAIQFGREILQRDTIPAILALLGDSFSNVGQLDSALVYYRKSLEAKPKNQSVTEKLAKLYMNRKEFDNVIAITDPLLADNEENNVIALIKAKALYMKEDYQSAIRILEYQESIGNRSYDVLLYLGKSYWRTKQYIKAEEKLFEAWKVDSSDVSLAYYIICVKNMLDRPYDTDLKYWLKKAMLMMKPDILNIAKIYEQYGLAHFKNGKDWEKAVEYYKKAYQCNPKQISYISTIAYCFEEMGDYRSALKWYEKYLKVAKPGSGGYEFVEDSINHVKSKLVMGE